MISDIALLYNAIRAHDVPIVDFGGIVVEAFQHEHDFEIIRYDSLTNMKIIWKLRFKFVFEFVLKWGDKPLIRLIIVDGDHRKRYYGSIYLTKLKGDLKAFERDRVFLKLYIE